MTFGAVSMLRTCVPPVGLISTGQRGGGFETRRYDTVRAVAGIWWLGMTFGAVSMLRTCVPPEEFISTGQRGGGFETRRYDTVRWQQSCGTPKMLFRAVFAGTHAPGNLSQ